jgi:DNA polymerase-3 subunit beta
VVSLSKLQVSGSLDELQGDFHADGDLTRPDATTATGYVQGMNIRLPPVLPIPVTIEKLSLEAKDTVLTIKSATVSSGESRLEASGTVTFTRVDDTWAETTDETGRVELAREELLGLLSRPGFAISTEETRYYLNGIYLHTAGTGKAQTLRAVATDGHRLAQVELPLPEGAGGMPGIIVPRKTVGEVQRLIEDSEAEVTIELSQGKIRFTLGDVVLTSKLIDGTFPDYARVIPLGNDKELVVDKKEFEAAVDRVSTVSSERGRAVKMSLSGGRLLLSVTNPDSGSATEELEVEYESEPIDIGFNSRYLLDIAAQIESEAAVLKLADPGSPTLIQDKESRGALYVLMPMRV